MNLVSTVVQRVQAGDRLAFCCDVYGTNWIELTSGLLLRHTQRIELSRDDVEAIKTILRADRRRGMKTPHRRSPLRTLIRRAVAALPAI